MKEKSNTKRTTLWICLTAMFMALNVAMSSFGVPVPGGHLYLNDIIICTAAIILDPVAAFIVGGVGAFLGDLFFYPLPMFVSLVTHGLQAVIISVFSHYVLKKHPVLASGIGVSIGAVIMVVGYSLGRAFIYSTPEYAVMSFHIRFFRRSSAQSSECSCAGSAECTSSITKRLQKLPAAKEKSTKNRQRKAEID